MAFDTFMYFTGAGSGKAAITMKGETTDAVYAAKNAFEIYSFSWGATNPVTIGSGTTGTGGGKVHLSSFNIMKKTDAASPLLFTSCAAGVHYPEATVVMRKSGGDKVVYLTYVFTEVFVESVQWSGSSGGDDTPSESVSFAFQSANINYWNQTVKGAANTAPVNGSWDVTTNAPASSTPATA